MVINVLHSLRQKQSLVSLVCARYERCAYRNRMWQKEQVSLPNYGHKRHGWLLSSTLISFSREYQLLCLKMIFPDGGLQKAASLNVPICQGLVLGGVLPATVKDWQTAVCAFVLLPPAGMVLSITNPLSHFQIPGPHKLNEILNIH